MGVMGVWPSNLHVFCGPGKVLLTCPPRDSAGFAAGVQDTGVKFSKLTKPKDLGGLSLSNIQLYYWSAQLKTMSNWFLKRKDSRWLSLEPVPLIPEGLTLSPLSLI